MMKNMAIREGIIEDIFPIYEISKDNLDDNWSEASILEDFNNKLSYYFVFEENNEIIGFISFWYVINEAHITNIAVAKENRGSGIGYKLIEYLIEFAKVNEMIGITLEVNTKNQIALNLYNKFDFVIEGTRQNYYEKSKDDAYILWKNL